MKKRIISLLLAVMMIVGMLPLGAITAFAESESSIVYLNEKGEVEATIGVAPITQYTTELTGGTYIVNSDITVNSRMYASGDVLLILADGHSLTVNGGIGLSGDNTVHHTLTITSQSFGENMGRLNAYVGDSDSTSSAIGADKNSDYQNFDIVINGGNITATGGYYSAGIGSGWGNDAVSSSDSQSICGNITINGGNITATGGTGGAGIGAGNRSYNGKSACGNITVNGGNITATGGLEAAGIGSGESASCGNITINGGNVTATGGSWGAGIGSGYEYRHCSCGDITVNGGYIKATGNDGGNNIGSGLDAHCGTVTYADGVIRKTEYGSEWVNITYIPGISATCVTSGYRDAYINLNDNQYYSAFPFPKTALGGESDYQNWIKPENDGYILPLGHEWVSLEYYNEGHKCIHDGCDLGGVHEDTDMDGKCDVCGCAICSHNNTVVVYEWDEYYNQCLAKIKCNDCEAYVDYEISKRVELIEDTPGATCKVRGKGHYEATFENFGTAVTDSIFNTQYGSHHYVDYVCEYCKDELLEEAKAAAIEAIDEAAGTEPDVIVMALVNAAKTNIDGADTVSMVIEIRNKWIAAIEKQTGTTHTHTYSENWSCDPYYHWHNATCEHTNIFSDLAEHTFDEGVVNGNVTEYTCSECGYKKFVYNTAGDNEGEIISGVSYTGVSLTLGSDIAINFYMNLTEEARQNGTMTFDIGGRIVTGIKVRKNENGYYFSTPLTALEMAETVKATFTYNGIDYVQKYSVADYIDKIVGNEEKYGTEAAALARKIANYGYYAQIYLESIHTNVHIVDSGDGYDRMDKFESFDIDTQAAIEALANYSVKVTGTSDNLSLYGSTVYFDSATALNYYVTVKNGTAPTATAVNTVTGKSKDVEIKLYKGNIYIVSVKDITATELADDIEVTINDDITITGSVFAYCNSVVKAHSFDGATAKDTFAVNAMAAFYEYYEAAMEYISFELHFDIPEKYKVFTADGEEITGDTTLKCYRTFSFRLVPDDKYIISMVNVEGLREPDENGLYTVSFTGGKHNVVVYTELDTYRLTVNVEGEDGGEMPDTKILFVYDSHESIEAQCWGPGIYKMDVPKGKSGTIVITKSGYQEYSQEFTADGTVEEISVSLVPDSFSVTFDMMGHGEQISSQTVEKGGKITKPTTPTADDKEFAGWFKDENRTVKWNFDTDTVTANTTLYAKWREKTDYSQYSLCGEINGEYYGIDFSTIYPHDAPYMFSSDGKLTVTISRTTAVKLRTLVAEYWYYFEDTAPDGTARKLHQTTFNNRGNGHSMVVKGRQVTFTLSKDEDGALMLGYEILPCTVSFNMMGHGSQIPSQTVKYEEYAQKPADPTEEGYIFDGWFMDETCTEPYDWDYWFVTEDITLYAKWTEYTSSLEDGYYLVGTLNGVNFLDVSSLTSDMKLAPSSIYDEYKLDWTFYANDEIKIVKIVGDKITVWYNNGGEYYKIGESNAGEGTLYFRPEGNAEWSYFYLTVTS